MSLSRKEQHQLYRKIFEQAFGEQTIDDASFQLYRSVHKAAGILTAATDEYLRPYHLTSAKFRILMWLYACQKANYPEGALPSQLSRMHDISPNTISALLNGLEDQGLIERRRHADDHRKSVITTTPAANELIRTIHENYANFHKLIFSDLTVEERQILVTLLGKMCISVQNGLGSIHNKRE